MTKEMIRNDKVEAIREAIEILKSHDSSVKCIPILEKIVSDYDAEVSVTIQPETKGFCVEHESFIRDFINSMDDRNLQTLLLLSDAIGDKKIIVGSMDEEVIMEHITVLIVKSENIRDYVMSFMVEIYREMILDILNQKNIN